MPLFQYKVSDAGGAVSVLLVEGESQGDAARRLQRRGLMPLEFLGEGALAVAGDHKFGLRRKFDVIDFTDRLVPLLQAHIPIERALGILNEGAEDPYVARVIADLRQGLHEGRKLSQLIRDRGTLFPRLYASVVEAGEEAGALPQVMADLRRFLLESRELRTFVITSTIYPAVVLAVSVGVIAVLLGVIVPKFASILRGAGQAMPLATRLLLGVSDFVRDWWWLFPVLVAGLVMLGLQARQEGRLRNWLDAMALKVPLWRQLVLYANLSRMARTMSILMRNGVHLLDTVAIAARVLQNHSVRQSVAGLASQLRQGQRLSAALGGSPFIPPFMLRMLAVGEETGAVDTMLERVAERYENDLRLMVRRILSLFEPATIIGLGLVVAGIVISMFLAILDLQSGV
ncbi:MAG: type II secretion system F family protein [Lentisphaeria bacterium]